MKNTNPKDILPKYIINHYQYYHARGKGKEYRVLSVNCNNRTFVGEDCKCNGMMINNLFIDDFYFFEFV